MNEKSLAISKKIFYIAGVVTLLFIMSIAVNYVIRAIHAINYPQPLDYGEGPLLNQVRLMLRGVSYYKDINTPPYIIGNYPPVYNLITSIFVPVFGLKFAAGRFVTLASVLLASYVLYLIVFKLSGNRFISILSGAFYLAIDYIYVWGVYMRVDELAILFNLIGIYWVIKYENDYKKLRFCIIFFLLALYTRQSMIAGTLAAFFYLFSKDKKTAYKLFCYMALIGMGIFALLDVITKGQFYLHIVKYNANFFTFKQLKFFMTFELNTYTAMLIIAGVFALYSLKSKKYRIISLYFISAFLVQLTVGKVGSMLNYLIEPTAAAGAVTALCFSEGTRKAERDKNAAVYVSMALILILMICNYKYGPNTLNWGVNPGKAPYGLDRLVESTKGPILAENLGILPAHDRDIYYDPFIFTQLSYQGIWDQNKIVRDIDLKKFKLIMLEFDLRLDHSGNTDRWSNEMKKAMYANYKFKERQNNIFVFEPK